jgi:hypothetical protein
MSLKEASPNHPKPISEFIDDGELREKLAAIEHERWSDWQKWCHKVLAENMPSDVFQDYVWPILIRWEKQADTAYKDLSDSEKASDMEQVDRYWPLIKAKVESEITAARVEELNDMLTGYTAALKDKPLKTKYTFEPLVRVLRERIAALHHKDQKGLKA